MIRHTSFFVRCSSFSFNKNGLNDIYDSKSRVYVVHQLFEYSETAEERGSCWHGCNIYWMLKGALELYQDIASDVGDLQRQRQHVELAHHLQDQLGIHPRQLQQVEQVRGVAIKQKQASSKWLKGIYLRSYCTNAVRAHTCTGFWCFPEAPWLSPPSVREKSAPSDCNSCSESAPWLRSPRHTPGGHRWRSSPQKRFDPAEHRIHPSA